MSGSRTSATRLKICRDRHAVATSQLCEILHKLSLGQTPATPQTGLRAPRLAHGRIAAKLKPELTAAHSPAGRNLVARRRRTTPSQTPFPAEGPLFQPSPALNIDPAPVHLLTHPTLPQPPARSPIPSCSSYRPHLTRITPSSHRHPHDSTPTPAPAPATDPYLSLIQSNQHSALPPARVSSPLYLFKSSQHPRLNQPQA